ncbi:MAG: SDR family NAD(P)-dependent oxidoreductase [Solirubrobacteraceae bacterium]
MPSARVQIDGATALVTGATGGLGWAISRALAERGAHVIATARREAELERLAGQIGGRAVVADLAVRHDVDRLITEAADADILVANAGVPATGRLADVTRGEIDRMLEINLRVPIILAKELSEPMAARGRGHVVFISSLAGKAASPVSSLYSATKFGLRGFALGVRQDLARRGIGVSVITPTFIRDAGMFHESGATLPAIAGGTKTPADVAAAVIRAIEENRAELDVASPPLRVGVAIASLAPGLAERASTRLGSHRVANDLAERHANRD